MAAHKKHHPTLLYVLLFLLLGTFLMVFYLQKQQDTRGLAEDGSSISFFPVSTLKKPLYYNHGSTFMTDMMLDPGPQSVTFVKLIINYDPLKLTLIDGVNSVQINHAAFPVIIEGPIVSPGRIGMTMSIGSDIANAVITPARLVTLSFKTIDTTNRTPTTLTIDPATIVLSSSVIADPSENVLSSTAPAFIKISTPKGRK